MHDMLSAHEAPRALYLVTIEGKVPLRTTLNFLA